MRRPSYRFGLTILAVLSFVAACGTPVSPPAAASIQSVQVTLTPYFTVTPSPTFAQAPELIFADTPLPTATPFTYTVKQGDTMGAIAEQFRVPLEVLMAANPNVSPSAMSVGQILLIPVDVNNPTGEATSTPAPFAVTQVQCYSTADGGMWCFALARNDSNAALDNLTARLSLLSLDGEPVTAQTAILPLNVLPPHASMPLTAFFAAPLPAEVQPRIQVLTSIAIADNDPRYLPASVTSLSTEIAADGRMARLSGGVELAGSGAPAKTVWVAAVAYDESGRVVGFRRWEWAGELLPGGRLPFDFVVSGFGSGMKRVEVYVEARP